MSELNFRVVIVPEIVLSASEKDDLCYEIKIQLEEICDIEVQHLTIFRKSNDDSHPEIEEFILQIDAKTGRSYPSSSNVYYNAKFQDYLQLVKLWKKSSPQLPCIYIMLYADDSFYPALCSCTEIKSLILQFGVLPHDGYFHQYAEIDNDVSGKFFHDTRNVILRVGEYFLEFSYDNIRNVFVNIMEYQIQLFFDLYNPPIAYIYKRGNFETYLRRRILNLPHPLLDPDILGRANVLCVKFSAIHIMEFQNIVANIRLKCSLKPIFYSRIETMPKFKPSDDVITEKLNGMPFSCTYMATALFKRNFVLLAQLSADFDYQKVIDYSYHNTKALENTLSDVLSALESGKIVNYWHAIENRYNCYVSLRNSTDFKEHIIPPRCFLTRKIIITPTRLMLWPPELLFGNRVIRKFDSDFAIRVSFREDNMQRLTSVAQHADIPFLEYAVKRPLMNGIRIGERDYKFLAWSNSQLRDHNVWMYAEDSKGVTSDHIRKWMGEFSHIQNVPKYMARMGQCFSQTVDTISVPLGPHSVRTVPDIVGGYDPESKKPYIFSDGIGRISTELAAKVHEKLGSNKLCCAFQIRYGGYKGMLVVDPTLKNAQIEFRESMKKFNCPNSTNLEIARTSAPVPLQLNRPFIAILNDLGVRDRVFLRLQENMLKSLTDMLYDEQKAVECLKLKTQALYDYAELSRSGIHLTTEKFFRNILLAIHRHQIGCLKSKANVQIDPDFARNMLGVLDETGILNYGEVFVQYSKDVTCGQTTRERVILEGEVLVTKCPCHHPGDVRKFTAIDVPQLHHIVDCIVFPQTGVRPHPNEMAGADLDGDEFAVIWLKDLIFFSPNKPAAHFPIMKCKDKSNIMINDMVAYFEEYIKKDQVGRISNAHLALVDRYGVESSICQAVARKVSIAVDFPKSGIVEPLRPDEKPKEFPDFMEKPDREEYKSQKALGKMYRICRDYETENRETSMMYQPVEVDPELLYPGREKYVTDAIRVKKKYDSILCSLLRNYGIEHEAEIISDAFTDLHCRFQERNDRMNVMKVVKDCFKTLMSDTMHEFIEEFAKEGCVNVKENVKSVLQKASAWYFVTYSNSNSQYLSFAWTVHKFLAVIKLLHTKGKISAFSPGIIKMDKKIDECERFNLLPGYKKTAIWNDYKFACNEQIVKRALKVLILWARQEHIIDGPNPRNHKGFLYLRVFIKLFLHVAKLSQYVSLAENSAESETKSFSSAKLCIEFLKFCSSLRFYNEQDVEQVLPFRVYNRGMLAKRAVIAYHKFALSGLFRALYFDWKRNDDLIDMNPFPVSKKLFASCTENSLRKAVDILREVSGAKEVRLREYRQTQKVWVSAIGTEGEIRKLKDIFTEESEVVKELFLTGKMPVKEIVDNIRENENENENEVSEDDDNDDEIIFLGEMNPKRKNDKTNGSGNFKRTKY